VAGLENSLVLFGDRDQFICLGRRSSKRLFHEEIESGVQQFRCDRVVVKRGNGDRSGIELEIGGEQILDGSEDRDCKSGFSFCGPSRIGLDRCHKSHALIGRLQFAIDTKVIAAESAGSNYGDTTIAFGCYR
jgi:hypothetical protein